MQEILLAIIAVLGSTSAWQYYEKRRMEKKEESNWVKMDCAKRIEKLEELLEDARSEKERLRTHVLELTGLVNQLKVKIEFLEIGTQCHYYKKAQKEKNEAE